MVARIRIRSWLSLSALVYLPPAHAYLDPITGSMIIQGLVAAIAGAAGAVAIKLYWGRLKAWFGRITGKQTASEETAGEPTARAASAAEEE